MRSRSLAKSSQAAFPVGRGLDLVWLDRDLALGAMVQPGLVGRESVIHQLLDHGLKQGVLVVGHREGGGEAPVPDLEPRAGLSFAVATGPGFDRVGAPVGLPLSWVVAVQIPQVLPDIADEAPATSKDVHGPVGEYRDPGRGTETVEFQQ